MTSAFKLILVTLFIIPNTSFARGTASSCEEKFLPFPIQDNASTCLPLGFNSPAANQVFQFKDMGDALQAIRLNLFRPLSPHAHKMGEGQKYFGITPELLAQEAEKKGHKFEEFFKKNYPSIQIPETKIKFWTDLRIHARSDFHKAVEAGNELKSKSYPFDGFIYIINPDMTLTLAPRTMKDGVDTADAKHISLAGGGSILASGELQILDVPKKIIHYNLRSGTYMASLTHQEQFDICLELKKYFSEKTALNPEFSESF